MMSAVFERLAELVNGDETLVRRGRFLTTTFLLEADDAAWLVRVVEGRIERVERGPFLMRAWSFAIRAPQESWQRFWEPVPAPGYHDLHFYRIDGDLRDRVGRIDTGRCPLYLLTGEYDFSCQPEDTRRTAAQIPGARVTIMKEIGHFPMSEHPAQFRRYLLPVLDEIRSAP